MTQEDILLYGNKAQTKICEYAEIVEEQLRLGLDSNHELSMGIELLDFQTSLFDSVNEWSDDEKFKWINFMTERHDIIDIPYVNFDPFFLPIVVPGNTIPGDYVTHPELDAAVLAINNTIGLLDARVVVLEDFDYSSLIPQQLLDDVAEALSTSQQNSLDIDDLGIVLTQLLSDFDAHINDDDVHIQPGERTSWNSRVTQQELIDGLDLKADLSHTHPISEITGLTESLDDLANAIADLPIPQDGDDGITPTITIGTVTTGSPSDVEVDPSSTTGNVILNFTLEQGAPGVDHFKGKYSTLLDLETAHPTAIDGDYGQVDAGLGSDLITYWWDEDEGWIASSGTSSSNIYEPFPDDITALKAISTIPLSVGTLTLLMSITSEKGLNFYKLFTYSGVATDIDAKIIIPTDYDSITNQKAWKLMTTRDIHSMNTTITSDETLTSDDIRTYNHFNVDPSGGAINIELPNDPLDGVSLIFKDIEGSANVNNITIDTTVSTIPIEETGVFEHVIMERYGYLELVFSSNLGKYLIVNKSTSGLEALFPLTYFVSPFGDDLTGIPGDISRPYTPTGAVALAVSGDRIAFLPGDYIINTNIAKDGVSYTTFGGEVSITVDDSSIVLFDYSASTSSLPIFISGLFTYKLNDVTATSSLFIFNDTVASYRPHYITWSLIQCINGAYGIIFPRFSISSKIEGLIDIQSSFTGFGLSTPLSSNYAEAQGGTISININNACTEDAFDLCNFKGYIININFFTSTVGGLSNNFGTVEDSVWTLNINQPSGTTSRMPSGGSFNCSLDGGSYDFRGNAKLQIDGNYRNCELLFNVTNGVYLSGRIDTCYVFCQNTFLTINANSNNMTLFGNKITLVGDHIDVDFNIDRVTELRLDGYIRLKDNEIISFDGNAKLVLNGTLVGNTSTGILRFLTGTNNKCIISGQVKNLFAAARVIEFVDTIGGNVHTLILKNAVIEAESTATESIYANSPATNNIKLYGSSYSNKTIAGPTSGALVYPVDAITSYIVDTDVEVVSI